VEKGGCGAFPGDERCSFVSCLLERWPNFDSRSLRAGRDQVSARASREMINRADKCEEEYGSEVVPSGLAITVCDVF
jgi:hypothetical protein